MADATIDADTFRALQESAGADFVVELIDAFLDDAPRMLGTLRTSLTLGDDETFRRTAHSLKSNSMTFGAHALAAMARDLELRARAVVQERDDGALRAIAAEQQRVAAALRELCRA